MFRNFAYQTLDSWTRARRVVGKAEHTPQGSNPRFVVANLPKTARPPRALYEDLYGAGGEAGNRIGEQFELFADRASSHTLKANQLRLLFSAMAFTLVETLRASPCATPSSPTPRPPRSGSSCSSSAPR